MMMYKNLLTRLLATQEIFITERFILDCSSVQTWVIVNPFKTGQMCGCTLSSEDEKVSLSPMDRTQISTPASNFKELLYWSFCLF